MPLYEYECTTCHRRTEKIQKFSDPELTVCPHCGGPLERTITAAAISFKGGGWYKDGYASAKPAASGEGSAGESSESNKSKSDSDSGSAGVESSATLKASSGEGAKSADSSKPSESSKPAPAAAAPAPSTAAKD
jgi:putative FmdB family regulatory protein